MKKYNLSFSWLPFTVLVLLSTVTSAQVNSLTTRAFDKKLQQPNTFIIDVRTPAEWRAGHITGARLQNVLETDTFKTQACRLG